MWRNDSTWTDGWELQRRSCRPACRRAINYESSPEVEQVAKDSSALAKAESAHGGHFPEDSVKCAMPRDISKHN